MEYWLRIPQSRKVFLIVMLFVVLTFCAVVFLDIPVVRQVLGFLFLTFIPGVLIVLMLNLKELTKLEKFTIAIGASIAFLMITGFFLNEFSVVAGFYDPLQTVPLMGILIAFAIIGSIFLFFKKDFVGSWDFENLRHDLYVLFLLALPLLSIVGAILVNSFGNNEILIFDLILISVLFVILIISKKGNVDETRRSCYSVNCSCPSLSNITLF